MRFPLTIALLVAAGRVIYTQRPADQTICDYYANNRYGGNNVTTQFSLMTSIIALAFGGGATVKGAPANSTGVFNPGNFQGTPVNLRSWFDGSKATTNLNNQPVGINWLDAGAEAPLIAFSNGSTDSVVMANTTNEYRLFIHWYTAFGFAFGCSQARNFPKTNESGGQISLSYVHKFMNLNQTHIGHFIDQLTTSSKFFGISDTDANTLNVAMNAKYNVRCAPAVNGQLNSLCQAPECPLAFPSPDCAAYVNLGPNGNSTATVTPTPSATATSSTTSAATSAATSTSAPSETSSTQLSSGVIAGIAIGSVAVLLFAVGLIIFVLRRPSGPQLVPVPVSSGAFNSPPHMSYSPNPHASYPPSNPHDSYMGLAGPGYFAPKPPEEGDAHAVQRQSSPLQSPPMQQIAEMESPQDPRMHSPVQPMDSSLQSPIQYMDPAMQNSAQHMDPSMQSPAQHMDHSVQSTPVQYMAPSLQSPIQHPDPSLQSPMQSPMHPGDYGHTSMGYGDQVHHR